MEYGKSKLIRLLENTPREGWTNQKLKDLIDSLWRDPVLLRWSGFENAGGPDTLISWNATDKIFSIAPLVVTFGFYQYRVKLSFHKRAVIESINMSEILAEGRYIFFYTYNDELLKHVVSFIHNPTETQVNEIFLYKTEIANLYWDADAGEILHFGDDRHGSEWNPQIHRYLHTAFRARRKSGLTITGASFGGDGSDNAHAKFSVIGGVMLHDDFELEIPSSSDSIPILYQSGFVPRYVYNSGYAIYKGAARACFNSGGAIIQAASGNFLLYHIFATNEIGDASRKIISVMGSAEYTTLADAYTAAPAELDALNTWMPQQGRFHIDTIVVQTSDDFTNDAASIIVSIAAKTHPPVTIADNSKDLLDITGKQELSIPGDFEADEFYGIKNRIWQKITEDGSFYKWNLHSPEQIIGDLDEPTGIIASIDGTGAVDTTIPTGTYAIVAVNDAGETLAVNVPEMVILADTTSVVVSWDEITGATGYRVYEVSTELYYDLISNVWLYLTQTPATESILPTENTAIVYQSAFAIDNNNTVEFTGENVIIEISVDPEDSTKKRVHFIVTGGGGGADGREVELSTDSGYIVWRYVGEVSWNNLIEIVTLVGDNGTSSYTYVAYATDNAGTGFSLTPTDLLKYRAEIHVISPLSPPVVGDFSGATWVKYMGDDGDDASVNANYLKDWQGWTFEDVVPGTAKTYIIHLKAKFGYIIDSIVLQTDAGTLTGCALKINGTAVTGMSSITITTTITETNASGANTVTAGDIVTFEITTGYSGAPTLVHGLVNYTKS